MLPAALFVHGQKALKGKASGGKAADCQGVYRRTAAGNGNDIHPVFSAEADKILSRVGNSGSAGVGYQGAGLAPQQPGQNGLPGSDVVMLVVTDERFFDVEMV